AQQARIDEQIHYVLASAVWINKMIEIAHEQPAERDTQFRNRLISQIRNLASLEKFHAGDDVDVFHMHASHSLQHLGVSSFAELQSSVRDARLVDTAKEPFLDEAHEEYSVIR